MHQSFPFVPNTILSTAITMLFNYPTFLTAACLLAVTAVAFPVEAPGDLAAPDALGVLDVRQDQTACPTTSRWERVEYITKYLATYTPTVEVIYGRNITSTATSTYHGSVTRWTTVYSPAVTTIPSEHRTISVRHCSAQLANIFLSINSIDIFVSCSHRDIGNDLGILVHDGHGRRACSV